MASRTATPHLQSPTATPRRNGTSSLETGVLVVYSANVEHSGREALVVGARVVDVRADAHEQCAADGLDGRLDARRVQRVLRDRNRRRGGRRCENLSCELLARLPAER